MQDNVTAFVNVVGESCVKEKGGYCQHKIWHFNLSVTQ